MENPFNVIPVTSSEQVKIWDFEVPSDYTKYEKNGRVRILAVVPRKPNPLKDIRVATVWCSPLDIHKFNKKKANDIVIGRYLKHFVNPPVVLDPVTGKADVWTSRNCGIVEKQLDTLEGFGLHALEVVQVPNWVDLDLVDIFI